MFKKQKFSVGERVRVKTTGETAKVRQSFRRSVPLNGEWAYRLEGLEFDYSEEELESTVAEERMLKESLMAELKRLGRPELYDELVKLLPDRKKVLRRLRELA